MGSVVVVFSLSLFDGGEGNDDDGRAIRICVLHLCGYVCANVFDLKMNEQPTSRCVSNVLPW
jgi:hypothetical protein